MRHWRRVGRGWALIGSLAAAAFAAAAAGCGGPEGPPGEQSPVTCTDGLDNDFDGATDCADIECAPLLLCATERENTVATCTDDVDNDGDGRTDCEDPACVGISACAERGDAACSNGIDDDVDGVIDCLDPTCTGATPCLPPPPEDCDNGADDDADGDADCDDADCSGDPGCAGAPALQPGECATHTFTTADPLTGDLASLYGVTEAQLDAALTAAKPTYGDYDFSGWACRWFAVDVMIPSGGAWVSGFSTTPAEERDYMVACRDGGSGAIVGDDDENGSNCTFFASDCGPRLRLTASGVWTCFFSVSPFDILGNGNSPTGGGLQACVTP